jgi:hypothetical protein
MEEHRLRECENRVLWRKFGFKSEEGGWRRKRNRLHKIYSSMNIRMVNLRRTRWAANVTRMGETGNAYNISVRKPE